MILSDNTMSHNRVYINSSTPSLKFLAQIGNLDKLNFIYHSTIQFKGR